MYKNTFFFFLQSHHDDFFSGGGFGGYYRDADDLKYHAHQELRSAAPEEAPEAPEPERYSSSGGRSGGYRQEHLQQQQGRPQYQHHGQRRYRPVGV